jgi:hypothetical protein
MITTLRSGYTWLVLLSSPAVFLGITGSIDPYHDGAIFPPSIAVAEGLAIYSEVNHQYGFIPVYINAVLPSIFGNYFIFYRISGLVFLIGNAFLIYQISKPFDKNKSATVLAVSSLLITPAWSFFFDLEVNALGSWPNVFAIFFTLLSIRLMQKALNSKSINHLLFFSGLSSSFSVGCRIQFLAVVALQLISLIVHRRKNLISEHFLKNWRSGLIFGILTMILFLLAIGSIQDAFRQLFLVWISDAPNSPRLGIGSVFQFTFSVVFACLLFILTIVFLRSAKKPFIVPVLLTLLLALFSVIPLSVSSASWLPTGISQILDDALARVLFSPGPFLITIFVLTSLKLFRRKYWKSFLLSSKPIAFYVWSTCLGMLFQFHNIYPDYIFMCIAPFFVLFAIFSHEKEFTFLNRSFAEVFVVLLKGILLFSVLLSVTKLNFERTYYNVPFLSGMQEYNSFKVSKIESNFRAIERIHAKGKFYFDCPYGIYSVNKSGYLLNSKWTWNEIPNEWRLENLKTAPLDSMVVACNTSEEWRNIFSNLESSGHLKYIESISDFDVYKVLD